MATVTEDEAPRLRHRVAILLSGVAFSLGGLIIRQIETADVWQITVYRSGFLALVLGLLIAWRAPAGLVDNLRRAGLAGMIGGLCLALAMTGFVWSVTLTTVANTLFILAASPFAAAALGWLLLGERVRGRTWATMAVAGLGIALMVAEGIAAGQYFGQLIAVLCVVGIGGFNVTLRWRREVDLTSAVLYAGLFSFLVGLAAAAPGGYAVPAAEVGWCFLYGGVVMVVGLGLYSHSGRYVPAAEVALLALSEVALGPLWVWLFVGETPSATSLAGGAVVLGAVVAQVLLGGRPRPLPPVRD